MLLLPFEPRRPTLALPGLEVTLLEAAAGLAVLGLLASSLPRLRALMAAPPGPLAFLSLYAAVHLLAAAFAEENRLAAFKFALRMAAMAAFAWAVAAAPGPARAQALRALVAAGSGVAALAVAEGLGLRALDGLLGFFRETPFNVGGVRRATAGSEYPNQAAAFLAAALLAWSGLGPARRGQRFAAISLLLAAGLLLTYSRGALAAAGLALLASALVSSRLGRPWRGPALALAVLAAAAGAFAVATEVFRLRLGGEGTEAWYAARYEPEPAPRRLAPGEARTLAVRLTNEGRKTWARDEAFHLSYHWFDRERRTLADGGRTELPADVRPGQSVEVRAEVVAPERTGSYILVWDMVHEHTTWFSGQGVRVATAEVAVGAPADASAEGTAAAPTPELGWQPGRAELWRIALAMWRAHPVLGAGPDNFRWLHGRYAGRSFWDTRVFANSTPLEAAATTGSLGGLALAMAWAACLGTAYRRLRDAAAGAASRQALALFALALGIVAHGLVDYFLAFTGHYLLLGLLAGSLSAPEPRPASDLA